MPINERKRQKKLARKKNKRKKTLLALKKETEKSSIFLDFDIGYPEKMSEVILEFAEPLLEDDETPENFRSSISFAINAWNISLMPPEIRQESIDKAIEILSINDEEDKNVFLALMESMIIRKNKYFSHINRCIVDYKILDTENGDSLSVVSSLLLDPL
jgi:hypothetical protein